MRNAGLYSVLAFLIAGQSLNVSANDDLLKLDSVKLTSSWGKVRLQDVTPGNRITGLNLATEAEVFTDQSSNPYLRLNGTFSEEGALLIENRRVFLKSGGQFSITLPLNSIVQSIEVDFVSIEGNLKTKNYRLIMDPQTSFSRFNWQASLGFTYSSYTNVDRTKFSEIGITPKIGLNYVLKPGVWDLGGNIFFTALPFTLSSPYAATFRYFGANGRIGYRVTQSQKPFQLSLQGGVYYITMFTSVNTFGFSNVAGPQLFPVFSYDLGNFKRIQAYFKYAPLISNLQVLSLSSHEIAMGFTYFTQSYLPFFGKHYPLSFSLDGADLALSNTTGNAQDQSITLGAGISF